jgi:anaerobic selenocysteine-containing dehydrogenase
VAGQGYLFINPADADKTGIIDGTIVKATSSVGSVTLPAKLSGIVQPGALFVPSHFRESQVGLLLKGSANRVTVKLEKA